VSFDANTVCGTGSLVFVKKACHNTLVVSMIATITYHPFLHEGIAFPIVDKGLRRWILRIKAYDGGVSHGQDALDFCHLQAVQTLQVSPLA